MGIYSNPFLALSCGNPIMTLGQTRGFNYQAVARNASLDLIPNAEIELQFVVREEDTAGQAVYMELMK